MKRFELRDTILFAAANYAHASSKPECDHDYGTVLSAEEKRDLIRISQNALVRTRLYSVYAAQQIRNPLIRDIGQMSEWGRTGSEAYVPFKANVAVPAPFCHVRLVVKTSLISW